MVATKHWHIIIVYDNIHVVMTYPGSLNAEYSWLKLKVSMCWYSLRGNVHRNPLAIRDSTSWRPSTREAAVMCVCVWCACVSVMCVCVSTCANSWTPVNYCFFLYTISSIPMSILIKPRWSTGHVWIDNQKLDLISWCSWPSCCTMNGMPLSGTNSSSLEADCAINGIVERVYV